MAAEQATAVRASHPAHMVRPKKLQAILIARVVGLLVAGIFIAFTATLHNQLSFDALVCAVAIGVLGLTHLLEWIAVRSRGAALTTLLLGIISLTTAALLPLMSTAIWFALAVAAWSLACALLEFIGSAVRRDNRTDATLLGAIGILLAVLVLLLREDPISVIGFFGAYAIIAGVFLGISSVDAGKVTTHSSADLTADTAIDDSRNPHHLKESTR
jgi:hypothetical protein